MLYPLTFAPLHKPRPRDAGASGLKEASRIEAAILETLLTPDTAEGDHP